MLDNYFITADRCHIIGINGGCGVTCEAYLDGECPEPTCIVLEGEQGYDRHIELYPTLGDMTMRHKLTKEIFFSLQNEMGYKSVAEMMQSVWPDIFPLSDKMEKRLETQAKTIRRLQAELETAEAAHENSARWNQDLRKRNTELCNKLTAAKENALLIEEQKETILRLSAGMDELNATKRETTIRRLQKELEAEKAAHENSAKWNQEMRNILVDADNTIAVQETNAAAQDERVLVLESVLEQRNNLLDEQAERILSQSEIIKQRQESLERSSETIDDLDGRLGTMREALRVSDEQYDKLKDQLIEMGKEISDKNKTIKERDKTIDDLQSCLFRHRKTFKHDEEDIDRLLKDYIPF